MMRLVFAVEAHRALPGSTNGAAIDRVLGADVLEGHDLVTNSSLARDGSTSLPPSLITDCGAPSRADDAVHGARLHRGESVDVENGEDVEDVVARYVRWSCT
jgi:hypothetical protein